MNGKPNIQRGMTFVKTKFARTADNRESTDDRESTTPTRRVRLLERFHRVLQESFALTFRASHVEMGS